MQNDPIGRTLKDFEPSELNVGADVALDTTTGMEEPLKSFDPNAYAQSYGSKSKMENTPDDTDGSVYLHPFRLRTETDEASNELRMYVNVGYAVSHEWPATGSTGDNTRPFARDEAVFMNGGAGVLENDLFADPGFGVGYEVLANSTTYGVWIQFVVDETSVATDPVDLIGYSHEVGYFCRSGVVVVSSTYTDPEEGGAFGKSLGQYMMRYIGQVTVDGAGSASIKQWLRSDVSLPIAVLPRGFVSVPDPLDPDAAFNGLSIGADGLLYVDGEQWEPPIP